MNDFDKKYRQRMAQHEVPVSPDFFKRVQQERQKQNKGIFYTYKRYFLLMLAIGVIGWVVTFLAPASPAPSKGGENVMDTKSLTSPNPSKGGEHVMDTKNPTSSESSKRGESVEATKSLASPSPSKGRENVVVDVVAMKSQTYSTLSKRGENVVADAATINDAQNKIAMKTSSTESLKTSVETEEKKEGASNISSLEEGSQTLSNHYALPSFRACLFGRQGAGGGFIALLPSLLPSELIFETPLKVRKRLGNECFNFKKRKNTRFFVEGYGSPQYADRRLALRDGASELKKYLTLRQSIEKSYWAYDAGLNIGFEHSSGFNLKAGVNYQQINEVFSYKIADYTMNTYNPDGSLAGTSIGERYAKTYNRYRFVQVPLLLGYNFGANRRNPTWSFGVHTGVGLNILTHHKGNLVPPSDLATITNFTPGSAQSITPFRPAIGLLLYADFTVYRQLTPNTAVFFAPKYTKFVQSITNSNFPTQQNYSLFGLTMGIKKTF